MPPLVQGEGRLSGAGLVVQSQKEVVQSAWGSTVQQEEPACVCVCVFTSFDPVFCVLWANQMLVLSPCLLVLSESPWAAT